MLASDIVFLHIYIYIYVYLMLYSCLYYMLYSCIIKWCTHAQVRCCFSAYCIGHSVILLVEVRAFDAGPNLVMQIAPNERFWHDESWIQCQLRMVPSSTPGGSQNGPGGPWRISEGCLKVPGRPQKVLWRSEGSPKVPKIPKLPWRSPDVPEGSLHFPLCPRSCSEGP